MLHAALHRVTLDNGLRVVVSPLGHLHTVSVGLFVAAGSRHEDDRTNGLSHMLEHMLFRGTANHPSAYALNLAIERLGGTLYGATHADFTTYQVDVPPANVEPVLRLFVEILTAPLFRDLDVEKRVLREEILEDLDEDGNDVDADNVVRQLLFSPHPLGFKITGSLDNVQGFTPQDLRAHLQRLYGARNMVLCVAGAVDEGIVEPIRRAFEPLPRERWPEPRPRLPWGPPIASPPSTTMAARPTCGCPTPRRACTTPPIRPSRSSAESSTTA
ncbi:MAG: M16 family metallopeptidase [Myxococcota bacterium]